MLSSTILHSALRVEYMYLLYSGYDIFQKVVFCLALFTEEVNLQTFEMM